MVAVKEYLLFGLGLKILPFVIKYIRNSVQRILEPKSLRHRVFAKTWAFVG
jgi:hypothetical protein